MDRNLFIIIDRKYYSNSLNKGDINLLFVEFLKEKKCALKQNEILQVIDYLFYNNNMLRLNSCLREIITYYEKKYSVFKVYNNIQEKKLLLIF